MSQQTIRVNGEPEPLGEQTTLDILLAEKTADISQRGIAVALNGSVVPRAAWRETVLRAGDSVEIVRARQGG
jgi:sulfur carrier protein